jgi:hypothetical protein
MGKIEWQKLSRRLRKFLEVSVEILPVPAGAGTLRMKWMGAQELRMTIGVD